MPEFALSAKEAHQIRADAVVVFCCKGDRHPAGLPASALRTSLARAMKEDRFAGKEGELLLWHAPNGMPASRYLVVGLGPADEFDLESVRLALASATRKLQGTARHVAAALPAVGHRSNSAARVAAAVEGVCLAVTAGRHGSPRQKKRALPSSLCWHPLRQRIAPPWNKDASTPTPPFWPGT